MQIVKRHQKGIEVNLMALLKLLWKSKWIILISGVVCALTIHIITALTVTPLYSATATLYANNSDSSDSSTSITSSDMTASVRLVSTYGAIIMSDPVLDQVIEANGLNISAVKLANMIEISSVNNTEVFKITVSYSSPRIAADIVNSIADIAPLKIAEIVDGCSIKVVSKAKVPTVKSYPNYNRLNINSMLIGMAMSALIVIIIALLDTRVRAESDLYEWDFPVLGVIPAFSEAERIGAYGYGYRKKEINKNELVQ